jgi:GNAT superfamily N-acetyltransferase
MTSPDGVPIETANVDDASELARLRWELYTEQEGELEALDGYRERFEVFAREALSTDSWRAWIARDDTGPVGAMWLQTVARIPVPGKVAGPIGYLTNVYVAPEHRNAGLGARMLNEITSWCRAEGYSLLIVWPTERSRPFYGRAGFARLEEPFVLEFGEDRPL